MFTYDDVLVTIGDFGRYQKFQYFLLCLVSIVAAFHAFNMVFVGATPEHHCNVDPTVSIKAFLLFHFSEIIGSKSFLWIYSF